MFPLPQTAAQPLMQVPATYLTFDIETGYGDSASIQRMVDDWQPPANIKDEEKIAARREAFAQDAKQKSALTDAAPIVTICLKTNAGLKIAFSAMGKGKITQEIGDWQVVECDGEAEMLTMLTGLLNSICDESTRLVGHNIILFDLPKLRNRMIRNGVKLPACLTPRLHADEQHQPTYDTMRYAKYFSQEFSNERFISFENLARALGLEVHKSIMSGADVPEYAEQGKAYEILLYNALDVEREEKAFLMMTGA